MFKLKDNAFKEISMGKWVRIFEQFLNWNGAEGIIKVVSFELVFDSKPRS